MQNIFKNTGLKVVYTSCVDYIRIITEMYFVVRVI